jgi:hypothetical protein
MSFYSKASKLLTNKYLLYFILFLAVTNVFGYLAMNKLNAVIFFTLVGIVTSFFSKNMIVILVICMFATNLLMSNKQMREGLENATAPTKPTTKPTTKPSNPTTPSNTDIPILPPSDINNMDLNKGADTSSDPVGDISPMTTMNKKQNKNGSSSRIDYASTLEEAYDNLDKILEGDGIKNLTNDTQNLMAKQQELFQTMQTMTPMLNQAKQMLEGFDMKSLQGLAGLATNFTSGANSAKPK